MKTRTALSLLFLTMSAVVAPAQTNFWWTNTVTSATNVWDAGGNWLNNGAPVSSADTVLNFFQPAPAYVSSNNISGFVLNRLNFSNSTVTIIGNALTFSNSTILGLPQINQLGASSATINVALTLTTNLTVAGDGSGLLTISGRISGAGGLVKNGTGTLLLSVSNAYTGGAIINQGTVRVGHTNSFGAPTGGDLVTVNAGGSIDLAGKSISSLTKTVVLAGAGTAANFGAIGNSGGSLSNLGIRNVRLAGDASIGNDGSRFDIISAGFLDGGGFVLTKIGNNSISLKNTATNLAALVVNAGTIILENDNAIAGAVVTNSATIHVYGVLRNMANTLVMNSGALRSAAGGFTTNTWSGPITLAGATNTFTSDGNNPLFILSGNISGDGLLQKQGTNTLVLAGTPHLCRRHRHQPRRRPVQRARLGPDERADSRQHQRHVARHRRLHARRMAHERSH